MARDSEIPKALASLTPERRTPWVAALLVFLLSAILLPIGDIAILAGLSSFAALLAFLAVNVALIALRYRQPKQKRPFRVPLSVGWTPILPVLAIAAILLLLAYFDWRIYVAGAAALLLSGLVFLIRKRLRGR